MFQRNGNDDGAACVAAAPSTEVVKTPPSQTTVERSVFKDTVAAHNEAIKIVPDRQIEVERLAEVIAEAAKISAAMESDISADGAASMLALVRGETKPDEKMGALVAIELASRAAAARLPRAEAELQAAITAERRADHQRLFALQNAMRREADKAAARYGEAMRELDAAFDTMVGINAALPPISGPDGQRTDDIAPSGIVLSYTVPLFNLPSISRGTATPTRQHFPDEWAIGRVRAQWAAAQDALAIDPDADLERLLKPGAGPTVDSLPPISTHSIREATHVDAGLGVNNYGLPV